MTCFLALAQPVLGMDRDGNRLSPPRLSYLALKRMSPVDLVRRVRSLTNDMTLALPAIDVISYYALKAVHKELQHHPEALHHACQKGDLTKVQLLLAAGASLGNKDDNNDTPLHRASFYGHTPVVEFLIKQGAYIDSKNSEGKTPLHEATKEGRKEVVDLLVTHGAALESRSNNGKTPLHKAAYWGYENVVDFLIEHGACVNNKDNNGFSPLHHASLYGHVAVVALLIKHGAYIDSKNNEGKTALYLAAYRGCEEVVELLLQHGASMDSNDRSINTPLHGASLNSHDTIVKTLMSAHFFPPLVYLPAHVAHVRLQERCLITLLNNLADFDEESLSTWIIPSIANDLIIHPRHNNVLHLLAHHAPLTLQQALIKIWKEHRSTENDNKITFLLEAHLMRHLAHIKDMVALENNKHQTARDLARLTRRHRIVTLLDHVTRAHKFSDLNKQLQETIRKTIEERLGVP